MHSLTKYLVHGNCLPFFQASQGMGSAVVLSLLALTALTFLLNMKMLSAHKLKSKS